MPEEPVVCRFIFTTKELQRAMRCFWRHSPFKWVLVIFVVVLPIAVLYPVFFPDSSSPNHADTDSPSTPMSLFLNLLPMIIFIGLMVYLYVFQARRSFRKGAYFNKEMIYTFRESGVHLDSALIESEMKWESFPRVAENQNGFALFFMGKRSFNWLPKSGFASPESIDQCRQLFRQHVKDSRKLFPS